MEEGKASVTAEIIAMFRAAHLLWDDRPKIFEDTLALQLSGCENEAALRVQLDVFDRVLTETLILLIMQTTIESDTMLLLVCQRQERVVLPFEARGYRGSKLAP
jgi:hypothetical protein